MQVAIQQSRRAARVVTFQCEKRPATGSRGMVVTNHPLASAAGAEMLLARRQCHRCGGRGAVRADRGRADDGRHSRRRRRRICGLPDGRHVVVDGSEHGAGCSARRHVRAARATACRMRATPRGGATRSAHRPSRRPAALAGWMHMLERYGTRPLGDVLAPAIRLAEGGFIATPYLVDCVARLRARSGARCGARARCSCRAASRSRRGSGSCRPTMRATLRRLAADGAGAALWRRARGERVPIIWRRMAAASRCRRSARIRSRSSASRSAGAIAAANHRAAAAGVERRAHRADAEHPRRLRRRRAWVSARPMACICSPRR